MPLAFGIEMGSSSIARTNEKRPPKGGLFEVMGDRLSGGGCDRMPIWRQHPVFFVLFPLSCYCVDSKAASHCLTVMDDTLCALSSETVISRC